MAAKLMSELNSPLGESPPDVIGRVLQRKLKKKLDWEQFTSSLDLPSYRMLTETSVGTGAAAGRKFAEVMSGDDEFARSFAKHYTLRNRLGPPNPNITPYVIGNLQRGPWLRVRFHVHRDPQVVGDSGDMLSFSTTEPSEIVGHFFHDPKYSVADLRGFAHDYGIEFSQDDNKVTLSAATLLSS